MLFKAVALASLLASATTAAAERERPRIFFPRSMRRHFGNSTTTTTSEPSEITPQSDSSAPTRSLSDGENLIGDILSDIIPSRPTPSPSGDVTPVVVSSFVFDPPGTPSTSSAGSETGILIGPTGLVSRPSSKNEAPPDATPPEVRTTSSAEPGLLDPVNNLLGDLLPHSTKNSTTPSIDKADTPPGITPPEVRTTSSAQPELLDPVNNLLGDHLPQSTKSSATPSIDKAEAPPSTTPPEVRTTSSAQPGLLDPVNNLLGDLLPQSTKSSATPSVDNAVDTDSKATSTADATTTSSAQPGLLDPVNSLLGNLLPQSTKNSSTPSIDNAVDPDSKATSTADVKLLPSLPLPLPILAPTDPSSPASVSAAPSIDNSTTPAGKAILTPAGTVSDVPTPMNPSVSSAKPTISGSEVIANSTADSVSASITPPAPPKTLIGNGTTPDKPTPDKTFVLPVATSSDIIQTPASENSTAPTPTLIAVPPPVSSTTETTTPSGQLVTSIKPTATLTNSNDWLPPTMVAEATSAPLPSNGPATVTAALPSNIPKIIMPETPDKPPPEGAVEIQIGFKFALNWLFVAQNPVTAAQIFEYMPQALAHAGDMSIDTVQITKLVPYDTRSQLGFITTLVKAYYPESKVDSLQTQLWTANSPLYNNDVAIVRALTDQINPNIPISDADSEEPGSSTASASNDNAGNNFNDGSGSGQSKSQVGKTAGIALGTLGLSVMYGAAMFIVARRYKRKRQSHQRSSSLTGSQASSEMGYAPGSPALMGGALLSRETSNYGGVAGGRNSHGSGESGAGHSARTANISAPVAAENSLGWN